MVDGIIKWLYIKILIERILYRVVEIFFIFICLGYGVL